jgi:hypothetical protein
MSGDILPLPQYAFMAWCSVKEQGQILLYYKAIIHPSVHLNIQQNEKYSKKF